MNDSDDDLQQPTVCVPETLLPPFEELDKTGQPIERGPGPGFCPAGNWREDGICRPFNNRRDDWMGYYNFYKLPIPWAIFPGTHNSGMDKEAGYTHSTITCQDVPISKQLVSGIRAFDLRVAFYPNEAGAKRFQFYHGASSQRTVLNDLIRAYMLFRSGTTSRMKEVIILDFHGFANFTTAAHGELQKLLIDELGSWIIGPEFKDSPLDHIWTFGKTVVVSYNHHVSHSLFWPAVNQRWIGKDIPSTEELKRFVEAVGNENHNGALYAIQAHKYTKVMQPDDFCEELMGWFAGDQSYGSPVLKYNIINTDWSLRCRMVDNIIWGNDFNHRYLVSSIPARQNPSTTGRAEVPAQMQPLVFYEMVDGNWIPDATLAIRHGSVRSTVLLMCRSTLPISLDMTTSNVPVNLKLERGEYVFLYHTEVTGKYFGRWVVRPRVYRPLANGNTPKPEGRNGCKIIIYQAADTDWFERVYLPPVVSDTSVIIFRSQAAFDYVIDGSNSENGAAVTIKKGQEFRYQYSAAIGKWRQF